MGLLDAFKQYWRDASPGGVLNPEIPKDTPILGLLADPVGSMKSTISSSNEKAKQHLALLSAATADARRTGKLFGSPAQDAYQKDMSEFVVNNVGPLMFIGKGAKTWNQAAADRALQMQKEGKSAREIWPATGTWVDTPDGVLRQEISDHLAKGRDYQLTPAKGYEQARYNAMVDDSQALRDRANSMTPYAGMTKKQLHEQYATTGNGIVDAAVSGDMELAKRLSSERSGLTDLLSEMGNAKYGPASSYLKHGELGKAYPDVYKMHTRIDPDALGAGTKAHYFEGSPYQGEQIVLGNKPTFSGDKSTMLHEMQHAIQKREGFARGGNLDSVKQLVADRKQLKSKFDSAVEQLKSSDDPIAKQNALQEMSFYGTRLGKLPKVESADEAYRLLAGEAEARATQARMNLTPEQRLATFPADSYDVPMDQLIVRGLLGR